MIAVVQRVLQASVEINGSEKCRIGQGLLILLGIGNNDREEDVSKLSTKISCMRIFSDADGKMNLSVKEINGEIMVVSQFTLYANTKKGNRPSFIDAARPETAIPLYESFIRSCEKELGKKVASGEFGADMKVSLLNDGPVTIIIDTDREKQL